MGKEDFVKNYFASIINAIIKAAPSFAVEFNISKYEEEIGAVCKIFISTEQH